MWGRTSLTRLLLLVPLPRKRWRGNYHAHAEALTASTTTLSGQIRRIRKPARSGVYKPLERQIYSLEINIANDLSFYLDFTPSDCFFNSLSE